jgi:hypothetical protein
MAYQITDPAQTKGKLKLRVELNGTNENPYHKFHLKQNPFPQLGRYEYDRQCLHLQKLGGDPIPNVEYIRNHLKGWPDEFVDLCCSQFKPGEYVEFDVYFSEE